MTPPLSSTPTDTLCPSPPLFRTASEVVAAGMAYRQGDVGGVQEITDANAAQVQAWIDEAPCPVLLHWASGNRAGALLAMVAARNGAPPEEALELGRRGMTSLQAIGRASCRERECQYV